ncbi:MAG: hypothetical protein ACKVQB_04070 [Bacteroidia bacterium]
MGYIKEPEGVDFIINSRPLTKDEQNAISEYIRAYKEKHSQKRVSAKRIVRIPTTRKKVIA